MACEQCIDGWVSTDLGLARCECFRVLKLEKMLARCGLPQRYQSASFETFDAAGKSSSVSAAAFASRNFVENFICNEGRGMMFSGSVGVGKTHLSISILRELTLRYSAHCYFTDFRQLLKQMQNTFGADAEETTKQVMRPIIECEALVIDELGAARLTDWTFEVAEEIINARYNAARSTIFTTNLPNQPPGWAPDNATSKGYGSVAQASRVETLGDRIGMRMFSRIQEMCIPVNMQGEDYRRKNAGTR